MDLLAQAVEKLGSVTAVARYLKVKPPYLFNVRAGDKPLAPFHEARLAELLERNPAQAYVEAQIRAAGKGDEAATLRRWFRGAASTIVAVFVAVGLSGFWTPPASASSESTDAGNPPEKSRGFIQCVHVNYLKSGHPNASGALFQCRDSATQRN